MQIEVTVSTKWSGCTETLIIDTDELGLSELEWANMLEDGRQEYILQAAYEAIGFSFSYDYEQ